MATLKDIRRRIRSVASTEQITKAMQMVAASKLRRSQDRILSARPYADTMTQILKSVAGAAAEFSHPLFEVRPVRRRTLVVIASDKGLCGSYNANLFRQAEQELGGWDQGQVDLIPLGRRASRYFGKRGWQGSYGIVELGDQVSLFKSQDLARHLVGLYARGETDRVDLLYTRFLSVGSRRIVNETILPIAPEAEAADGMRKNYIFEPTAQAIFGRLLPRYVQTRVMTATAESLASEHASRLVSMSAATKNAGDMITALTLVRNKLRQAAITKEISELVGAARE